MKQFVAAFVLNLSLTSGVSAQNAPHLAGEPMRVRLAQYDNPGCSPDCPEWIFVEGNIVKSAIPEFRAVLRRIGKHKLPVLLHSPGGDVDAAMELGRIIRQKGLDVVVARTEIAACSAQQLKDCKDGKGGRDVVGLPTTYMAYCLSACPLVLAGGLNRVASDSPLVGVHGIQAWGTQVRTLRQYRIERRRASSGAIVTHRTLISEKVISRKDFRRDAGEATYRKIAAYLREMGVSDSIVEAMRATPFSSMKLLEADTLEKTGLARGPTSMTYIADLRRMAASAAMTRTAMAASLPPRPEVQKATVSAAGEAKAPDSAGGTTRFDLRLSYARGDTTIFASARILESGLGAVSRLKSLDLAASSHFRVEAVNRDAAEPEGPLVAAIPLRRFCASAKVGHWVAYYRRTDSAPSKFDTAHPQAVSAFIGYQDLLRAACARN